MLQELEILVDHDIQNYATRLLLNYKPTIDDNTYCFYLPLEVHLQHRSQISRHKVRELIDYLNLYLKVLETEEDLVASQKKEPNFEQERGISVAVDTNPSRE